MVKFKVEDVNFDKVYPVGAIYMSINSTDPSELFGGEWEQIEDRFLLACGTTYSNGATGGEATHKLTVNEIPSHRHEENGSLTTGFSSGDYLRVGYGSQTSGQYTNYTGGGQAHNNMPPYLAVYMWVRVG